MEISHITISSILLIQSTKLLFFIKYFLISPILYYESTVEPLIAYTLILYEGGASGRSRLVGGGFSL